MGRWVNLAIVTATMGLLVGATGCPTKQNPTANNQAEGQHGHSHAHDHSHDEGPSGGHVITLGDEEYHVEWLHDDEEGVLTFIILDGAMKEEVPIDAENIVVEQTIVNDAGESKTLETLIPAEGRTDEHPTTARFVIADKSALYNITENPKVTAVLKVTINGKNYSAKIEHDAHHGHSHSHD